MILFLRILVILVLVGSFTCAWVSIKTYNKNQDNLADISQKKAEIQKLNSSNKDLEGKLSDANARYVAKERELSDTVAKKDRDIAKAINKLSAEKEKLKRIDQEKRKIQAEIAKKIEEAQSLQSALNEEKSAKENYSARLEEVDKERKNLEGKLNEYSLARTKLEEKLKTIEAGTIVEKGMPSLNERSGKVLAVNEKFCFLVISFGSKDGVVENDSYLVHKGDRLITKVYVEKVYETMSVTKRISPNIINLIKVNCGVRKE